MAPQPLISPLLLSPGGFGPALGACHAPRGVVLLPLLSRWSTTALGDALLAAHTHVLTARIYVLPYTAAMPVQRLILPPIPYTCPEAKHCLFSCRAAVTLFHTFKCKNLWRFKENQKQVSRICVLRTICSWNGDPMLYFPTRSANPLKRQIQTLSEIRSLSVWSTTCLLLQENTPESNFILKIVTISRQNKLILPKPIADGT